MVSSVLGWWALGLLGGTRGTWPLWQLWFFTLDLNSLTTFYLRLAGKSQVETVDQQLSKKKSISWRFICVLLLVVKNLLLKASFIFSAKVARVVELLWPGGLLAL